MKYYFCNFPLLFFPCFSNTRLNYFDNVTFEYHLLVVIATWRKSFYNYYMWSENRANVIRTNTFHDFIIGFALNFTCVARHSDQCNKLRSGIPMFPVSKTFTTIPVSVGVTKCHWTTILYQPFLLTRYSAAFTKIARACFHVLITYACSYFVLVGNPLFYDPINPAEIAVHLIDTCEDIGCTYRK